MAGFELIRRLFGGADMASAARLPRSRRAARRPAVLVVDDSATIRAVLGKMLAQDGHVVLTAADGEAALRLARTRTLPDLIFLDIVMPGMSGFAVLRALRHDPLTQDIPIVMISGNLQATEQFYVQRFGADDFMKKPFGRGEVFARIEHLTSSGRLVVRERRRRKTLPASPEHHRGRTCRDSRYRRCPIPHDLIVPPPGSPELPSFARRQRLIAADEQAATTDAPMTAITRADVWLWAARFFKTRSLARQAIEGGRIDVNEAGCKPARTLQVGDRLRISRGEERLEVEVLALSRQARSGQRGADAVSRDRSQPHWRAKPCANSIASASAPSAR